MHSSKQRGINKKIIKKVIKGQIKEQIPIKTSSNAKFDKKQILNPLFGAINSKEWIPKGGINHLDRGFFDVSSISVFFQLNEDFIIAGKRNKKIDKIIKEEKESAEYVPYHYIPGNLKKKKAYYRFHVEPYTMKKGKISVTFKLVILFIQYDNLDKKDEIFIFGTNLQVSEENVLILFEGYRKRWSIETGFRVKKEVKGKTNSPNYVIRILFLMLSILL